MSCVRSSGRVGVGDLSSRLGDSSSTCSLEGDPREASNISSGWIEKSIGGSKVTIEGRCGSSGKRSKTKEVDREPRK